MATSVEVQRAADLSAYRAAWANMRRYFDGDQFSKDYPNVMVGRTEIAAIVTNLIDDLEKDYGIKCPIDTGEVETPGNLQTSPQGAVRGQTLGSDASSGALEERPEGTPVVSIPSREWLLRMADAEDRCGSVAVGVPEDGGEYLSPTAMRLLRSMAGLGDDASWIDVAPVLSAKLRDAIEWKNCVLGALKLVPQFESLPWGGDKNGWGFCLELINLIRRENKSLERTIIEQAAVRSACLKEHTELSEAVKRAGYRAVRFDKELRIIPVGDPLTWDESAAGIGTEPDCEVRDVAKELVAQDICPKCKGELDTGWECNDCGYDAKFLIPKESQ